MSRGSRKRRRPGTARRPGTGLRGAAPRRPASRRPANRGRRRGLRPDVAALERFLRSLGLDSARDPEYAGTAKLAGGFLAERTAGLRRPQRPLRPLRYRGRAGATVSLEQIPVYGLCPHHLTPYFGVASLRYAPRERVAGAGSLARTVRDLTLIPRIQEDLTEAIAEAVERDLSPRFVEVRVAARHFCLEMRGVEQRAAFVTEARRGAVPPAPGRGPAAPRAARRATAARKRRRSPRARARRARA